MQLLVAVDWAAWPTIVKDQVLSMANQFADWQNEFATNIQPIPETLQLFSPMPLDSSIAIVSPWEPFADTWDWDDLDHEFLEDYEPHDRVLNHDKRA